MAPSQPGAAVAGVQLASRQHSSLVPFFQASPEALRQLSTDWAPAAVARAAEAINIAALLRLFMVFLLRDKAADSLRKKYVSDDLHLIRWVLLCHRRETRPLNEEHTRQQVARWVVNVAYTRHPLATKMRISKRPFFPLYI
jgi:hypothetical protein